MLEPLLQETLEMPYYCSIQTAHSTPEALQTFISTLSSRWAAVSSLVKVLFRRTLSMGRLEMPAGHLVRWQLVRSRDVRFVSLLSGAKAPIREPKQLLLS